MNHEIQRRHVNLLSANSKSRSDGGDASEIIDGHASVWGQPSILVEFAGYRVTETWKRGAFSREITENKDIRALINHDSNLVLGRTIAGTLSIAEDDVGLATHIQPPETSYAKDLVICMRRGDISGMSIQFRYTEEGYKETITTVDGVTCIDIEVSDCELIEVSVVTFPQFTGTDAAIRSIGDFRAKFPVKTTPRRNSADRSLRLAGLVN